MTDVLFSLALSAGIVVLLLAEDLRRHRRVDRPEENHARRQLREALGPEARREEDY